MTVPVCPKCESAQIARRTPGPSESTDGREWRCDGCKATFDDPARVESGRGPMNGYAAVLSRIGENGGLE